MKQSVYPSTSGVLYSSLVSTFSESSNKPNTKVEKMQLGITTLKDRRERGNMIEVYKLLTGKEQIDCKQFFKPAQNHYGLRGHGMKLTKERSRLDTRKSFFSQPAVNGWNSLPAGVVNAESVNAFKNACNRNYKNDFVDRSQ